MLSSSTDKTSRRSPEAMTTRVALFVPCYIDQLYPQVAMATLEVLEYFGCEVEYVEDQTCCGQPMANSGVADAAISVARRWINLFADRGYVVGPSGSCISMIRNHYAHLVEPELQETHRQLAGKCFEFCEFLYDVLEVRKIPGRLDQTLAYHASCHGLRELRLGGCSERMQTVPEKVLGLLGSIDGVQLELPARRDECCGFGGTFAINEEGVSVMMGRDRLDDLGQRAKTIVATDSSCLMHMQGIALREKRPLQFRHVAEIFAEAIRQAN